MPPARTKQKKAMAYPVTITIIGLSVIMLIIKVTSFLYKRNYALRNIIIIIFNLITITLMLFYVCGLPGWITDYIYEWDYFSVTTGHDGYCGSRNFTIYVHEGDDKEYISLRIFDSMAAAVISLSIIETFYRIMFMFGVFGSMVCFHYRLSGVTGCLSCCRKPKPAGQDEQPMVQGQPTENDPARNKLLDLERATLSSGAGLFCLDRAVRNFLVRFVDILIILTIPILLIVLATKLWPKDQWSEETSSAVEVKVLIITTAAMYFCTFFGEIYCIFKDWRDNAKFSLKRETEEQRQMEMVRRAVREINTTQDGPGDDKRQDVAAGIGAMNRQENSYSRQNSLNPQASMPQQQIVVVPDRQMLQMLRQNHSNPHNMPVDGYYSDTHGYLGHQYYPYDHGNMNYALLPPPAHRRHKRHKKKSKKASKLS